MPALLRLLTVCASLAFVCPHASAQNPIPGFKPTSAAEKKAEAPSEAEQIQSQLKETRASLARLDQPEAETQLPSGISADALAERRRDLDQTARTLNRTATLLQSIPDARKAADVAKAAESDWSHFPEKPPYSLLLVDDLQSRRDASAEKASSSRSSLSLFQRSLENLRAETAATEDKIRELTAAAASAPDDAAAKWKLAAANDKSRAINSRTRFVSANIELFGAQIDAAQSEIDLLDRQIRAASKNASLSEDDITKIRQTTTDRIASLRKEGTELRSRTRQAVSERSKAKETLDQAAAKNTAPDNKPDPLLVAQLETAETRSDVLQFITDNLDAYASLESLTPDLYQKRREYLEAKSRPDRQAALQDLRAYLDRLVAWQTVSSNELSAVIADLGKQDSLSNLVTAADPRLKTFAERREILWEKQQFLQRIVQSASYQQKNLSRWIRVFDEAERPKTWDTWLDDSWAKTKTISRRIWTFELTRVPTATGTQSIELGLVISAVIFFLITYFIIGRLTRRLQSFAVNHGRIAEAQANTMRNWLMILAGAVLALTTLHLLKIPLTVFAFFGGALAIGLGFGTQTLIKNFMSGIIVLFERRIRVGDIIEVGTVSGKVVEINTRSSVVRSADGKETLVPNSVFLESQVTNQTLSNRRVRRTFRVGVAYGSSPSQVITLLKECLDRHGLILKDPAPVITLEDFGSEALVFALYYWTEINSKTDATIVASDVRIMIEKRFAETGVEFPKTQRDQNLLTTEPLRIELIGATNEEPLEDKKQLP
ncbi:MAG TPA: mechanosensitive ion channel domain-containing protein [Luteolibacter sp.]|nr:mechanosensitive ion channel domain-containing protein [Luteolibacter sp.]